MSFYVTTQENGDIATRHIKGIGDLPEHAMGIDEAAWLRLTQEVDGIWAMANGALVKRPHPIQPDAAEALIAKTRYERETAGIQVDTLSIDTRRESQAQFAGAAVQAMLEPQCSLRWKTSTGFVELSAQQVIDVTSAIRRHVQACFDRESTLLKALASGDYTDAMLDEGWPTVQEMKAEI